MNFTRNICTRPNGLEPACVLASEDLHGFGKIALHGFLLDPNEFRFYLHSVSNVNFALYFHMYQFMYTELSSQFLIP